MKYSEKIKLEFDGYKSKGIVPFCCDRITTIIVNGKEKKDINPPVGHDKITLQNCDNYNNGDSLCVGTGKRSGITVVDFDNKETYNKLINEFPELKTYKTIKTNKGYHIYFKYEHSFKNRSNAFDGLEGVDVRNDSGFVFTAPTKYRLQDGTIVEYIDLGGEINEMHEVFKRHYKNDKTTKKDTKKEEQRAEFGKIEENYEQKTINSIIEDGLLDYKASNFNDWVEVGMALSECSNFESFNNFSKRSEKYDLNGCVEQWATFKKEKKNKLSYGSLIHWAKESPVYDNRFEKSKDDEGVKMNDRDVGQALYEMYKHRIVKNNGVLLAYYKHSWCEDTKMVFTQWIQMSDININPPKLEPCLVGSLTSKFNNYLLQLTCICIENIDSKNILNQQKDLLRFENGYYNFQTGEFKEYTENDVLYTTFKVNRNFPLDVDLSCSNEIKRIIYDIFNNVEEEVDEYFSFNARALSNHIEDKVGRIVVGERNSGKGVITYLNSLAFDGVIGTVDNKELAYKKGSFESAERRNGFLKNFCDNLLCITEEVDPTTKIDGTLWKTITSGGDKISYRTAFGHLVERAPLKALYSVNCNKTPDFSLNDACESMILYNMPCKYVEEIPLDECDRGFVLKIGDHTIKTRLSTDKYIDAYTLFVLSFYKSQRPKYPIMTEMSKEHNEITDDYIDTKDKLATTVNSLYIINILDKSARVKRSDVHKSILNKFPDTTPQKIKVFLTNKKVSSIKYGGIYYYQGLKVIETKEEESEF